MPSTTDAGHPAAAPDGAKRAYQRVRAELDFAPSFLPNLCILFMDVVLLASAVHLLRSPYHLSSFLLSQVLLAIVFFNSFSILHECGHGSESRHRWLNALVGHYASTFCFIPYYPWKYIHQKHHAWTGNITRDPVLKSLRTWRERGTVPWIVRASWRSWIPLGALLQHIVYLTYPYRMWRDGELTPRKRIRTLLSIAWLPVAWFGLASVAPELLRPANLAIAFLLFLIAEELVNIPHHVDMSAFEEKLPIWKQHLATRSCYYPRGVSELLVLNFNFHIEHHFFPSLPWYRLRRARTLLQPALGADYQEAVGVQWNLNNRARGLQSIVDAYRADTQMPIENLRRVETAPEQ